MPLRNLALLLLYCLVVVPAGVLARLVHDPLHRRVDRAAPSYWNDLTTAARGETRA
ncbi:hypothetical protein [Streptomyces coerulescens]|uniref:Uncharacterized protein n=1 Tax=Streptomyces coerulescens TaxID=29304 RepID=A0ABW0CZL4_STRCD